MIEILFLKESYYVNGKKTGINTMIDTLIARPVSGWDAYGRCRVLVQDDRLDATELAPLIHLAGHDAVLCRYLTSGTYDSYSLYGQRQKLQIRFGPQSIDMREWFEYNEGKFIYLLKIPSELDKKQSM